MTVVSDSSPLVILAKLGCFDLLNRLFPHLYISAEVHREVVVSGVGLAGASEVAKAEWIEVKELRHQKALLAAREKYSLGDGELSTILLAKETQADVVLLDDFNRANSPGRKAYKSWEALASSKRFICKVT